MVQNDETKDESWQLPDKVKEFAWKINEYFEGNQDVNKSVQSVFKQKS
jgi:hypothetical protein